MAAAAEIHRQTRRAGLLYLAASVPAIAGFFFIRPRFFVSGDAAATALRIVSGEQLYRLGIVLEVVSATMFLLVALSLYRLLRDTDRALARMMVILLATGVAAQIGGKTFEIAPLTLLSGADFLSAFDRPQIEALAYFSLRVGRRFGDLVAFFWGVWLFPFAILVFRSGFLPRFLAVLLFLAGAAYVATFVTTTVFPAMTGAALRVAMPFFFGELLVVLWLAIMGARPASAIPPNSG
jgi:hypothetical protein